jgi:two-component system sensor histidine kinase PilS (NtrC family)
LGLYICRELCERYGASIAYRQRGDDAGHRNEFIVVMNREALSSTEQRLQLAP